MSVLRTGDEDLHNAESGHIHLCPDPGGDQEAWLVRVAEHLENHRRASHGEVPRRHNPPPSGWVS